MSTASGLLGFISEQLYNAIKTTASDADFITTYCCAGHGVPGIAARAIRDRHHDAAGVAQTKRRPIGGGVAVGRFEKMFLRARSQGLKRPADWAAQAWNELAKQNQQIIKGGEVLKTAEANLEELNSLAKTLSGARLSLLQRLRVVD